MRLFVRCFPVVSVAAAIACGPLLDRTALEAIGGLAGRTPPVAVATLCKPVAALKLSGSVEAPMARTAVPLHVAAVDAAGNPVTACTATVHFASTDPNALPGDKPLVSGVLDLVPGVAFSAAGTHSITASLLELPDLAATWTAEVSRRICPASFAPPVPYATNNNDDSPDGVAVGDMDRDGDMDLVVGLWGEGSVVVLANDGNGAFTAPVTYPAGSGIVYLVLRDVNKDGYLDVIAADYVGFNSPGFVRVLLNQGDGRLGASSSYATGNGPWQVALGDVNGDGVDDIAVSNQNSTYVSVFLGRAGGTFLPQQQVSVPGNSYSLALADVDHDPNGRLDLIVTGSNDLWVLKNNGFPTYGAPKVYAMNSPAYMTVADLDGNGSVDLLVPIRAGNANGLGTAWIGLNDGSGTFTVAAKPEVERVPYSAQVADFDGDGTPDGAVLNHDSWSVSILTGTAGMLSTKLSLRTASEPWNMTLGDVNGDNRPDIVVSHDPGDMVEVFINTTCQ